MKKIMITFFMFVCVILALQFTGCAKADSVTDEPTAVMVVAGEAKAMEAKTEKLNPEEEEASARYLVELFNKPYDGFERGDGYLFDELQRAYHDGRWNGSRVYIPEILDFKKAHIEGGIAGTVARIKYRYKDQYATLDADGTLTVVFREQDIVVRDGEPGYEWVDKEEGVYNINFPQAYLVNSIPAEHYLATEDGVFSIQGDEVRLDRLPAKDLDLESNGTCRFSKSLPEGMTEVSIAKASTTDGLEIIIEDFLGNGSNFYRAEVDSDWELINPEEIDEQIYACAARHFLQIATN